MSIACDKREINESCDALFANKETVQLEKQSFNNVLSSDNEELQESVNDSLDDDIHTNSVKNKIVDQIILSQNGNGSLHFSCAQCKKIFRSKYGLNAHIKIHLDLKNSKCEICGKQFTRYFSYLLIMFFNII